MIDRILTHIATLDTGPFFVTVIAERMGEKDPSKEVEHFLYARLERISAGCSARKFVFDNRDWRLVLTFFPTHETVNERYALKNKVQYLPKHP